MQITETPEMRQRLQELYEGNGNIITAEIVMEDARNPSSPLNKYYDWDVQRAAREHWLEVSRAIIRAVKVEIRTDRYEIKTFAYVHPPGNVPGYKRITEIKTDREIAVEQLTSEFQRVADNLRRCREIAAGLGLESEVDALLQQLGAVREVVVIQRNRLATRRVAPPPRPGGRTRRRR